jgi:hypothetical protein
VFVLYKLQVFISCCVWLFLGTQGFFLCLFVSGTAADGVSAACTSGTHHFAGIGVCSFCSDQAAEDGNRRFGDDLC